jgi:CRP-like cAMP-binding protein
MMATNQTNNFLASLDAVDLDRLRPHLREVPLKKGAVLFDQGARINRIYFPTSGVVSFVVPMADGSSVEAGMIGRDGVVGTSAALNGSMALNRATVQSGGAALAIDAGPMRSVTRSSELMQQKLYTHDQFLTAQAQQSAACNGLHQIEERLCRWILRTSDVLESRTMDLTQEFLAQMLGVRRTSVTLAARHLQAIQMIKYRRGNIEITDPDGLRDTACECYEAVRNQHARLFDGAESA